MAENISLDEIKKFWPSSAPNISNVNKYVKNIKVKQSLLNMGAMY